MSEPLRTSTDDQSTPVIGDDVSLLRRIPPWHFVDDKNSGRRRPSSAAFEDDGDGDPMSVYRLDVIEAEGDTAARVMVGHQEYGLAALTAWQFRSKQQEVRPDPLPNETAHAQVVGHKTNAIRRWFAREAQWIIPPP